MLRLVILFAVALCAQAAFGYGPTGHQIVGAIADARLANTAAGGKVKALLDGFTLEKASVIPDEIKGWDKRGADDPNIFHYSSRPAIDAQLRDFWRANQPTHDRKSAIPSHHWFHYADVPLFDREKYAGGSTGRSQWDIVHMTRFCIDVLTASEPADNPRKITKPIAVILLAHYVGDIHQPLHVGTEYFDRAGHIADPARTESFSDDGGNTILLELKTAPQMTGNPSAKLHTFWDNDVVMENLPALPPTMPKEERRAKMDEARAQLAQQLARTEPKAWRIDGALNALPERWADEILPIAREAHERLQFERVAPLQTEDGILSAGIAEEKPASDHIAYATWAPRVAREELQKAGWRLADLLERIL